MRKQDRQILRTQYEFRCGYCGVRETDVGAELTIDHFQPRSQGGSNALENLVYCCHACNEFKGDYWQPEAIHRILHPQRDDLSEHVIELEDGTLQPLTETGAFHIQHLHLNREELIEHRLEQLLTKADHIAWQATLDKLSLLEQQVVRLKTQISMFRPVAETGETPDVSEY